MVRNVVNVVENIALVNKATGEIIEDKVLVIGRTPTYKKDKGFVKVFVTFLTDVVTDEEISGKAIRLLLHIVEQMDYNSLTVYLDREEIMEMLDISVKTYYNWLNALIDKGYIKKISSYKYKLEPYNFVKGTMDEAIKKEEKKERKKEIQKKINKVKDKIKQSKEES